MGRSIRDDAIKAQSNWQGAHVYDTGEQPAAPDSSASCSHQYRLPGRTIGRIEQQQRSPVSIESVKRDNALVGVEPSLKLAGGDVVLVVGRRAGVVGLAEARTGDAVLRRPGYHGVLVTLPA